MLVQLSLVADPVIGVRSSFELWPVSGFSWPQYFKR